MLDNSWYNLKQLQEKKYALNHQIVQNNLTFSVQAPGCRSTHSVLDDMQQN